MITTEWAWWNGRMVPLAEAKVSITSFALHYGMGIFEGVRCYERSDGRGAIFRLREHVERLFESAKIVGLPLPFAPPAIEAACVEVMRKNGLVEAYIRPFAFVGAGALGIGAENNPTEVAVICWPWSSVLGEAGVREGIRANLSSYVRGHTNHTMAKAKIAGQYVSSVLAKRESQRLGFDEALMLDAEGRVVEGSAENLFVVYRGRLLTPPLDLAILNGITRDTVIVLARELGIEVAEQAVTRDMLYTASEVFVTGTGAEIGPVREIDGRPVGEGRPGAITRKLQERFFEVVRGPGEPHPEWLTSIG